MNRELTEAEWSVLEGWAEGHQPIDDCFAEQDTLIEAGLLAPIASSECEVTPLGKRYLEAREKMRGADYSTLELHIAAKNSESFARLARRKRCVGIAIDLLEGKATMHGTLPTDTLVEVLTALREADEELEAMVNPVQEHGFFDVLDPDKRANLTDHEREVAKFLAEDLPAHAEDMAKAWMRLKFGGDTRARKLADFVVAFDWNEAPADTIVVVARRAKDSGGGFIVEDIVPIESGEVRRVLQGARMMFEESEPE